MNTTRSVDGVSCWARGSLSPLLLAALLLWPALTLEAQAQEPYDIVILHGRVMDPESGRDEVANVGVQGKRIAVITQKSITGRRVIDASELVVAPGFIDILGPLRASPEAHVQKIHDGVTSAFGMHGGPLEVEQYHQEMAAVGPLVNYARTVDHRALRRAVGATDPYQPATPEQITGMKALARQAVGAGAVGIGFGINYVPGASYEEIFALFEVAAELNVPCHVHARYKGNIFPLTMSLAVQEIIAMATATGAQAQFAHLTSSTVGSAPLCLKLIEGAAARGVDVDFDFHVWTRNETWLQSALYDSGWQERFGGISYDSIYVASTQERLTPERFKELRQAPTRVVVQTEFIPEAEIEMALRSPLGMVSSDGGGLVEGKGHPRSVGTFARLLRRYVREKPVLSLMEALRRITLSPARRLEKAVPAMKKKGRLQAGCDADITVFNPETIRERATYAQPFHHSEGISYVVVNGTVVLDASQIVKGVSPGQWLRHPGH